MRHPRVREVQAFTLLELLVVMAIIAVVAGILLPAVRTVRARAQGTTCQANLRIISTTFLQYTTEYGDHYPFGFVFNKQQANGRPVDGSLASISYIAWFSCCDKYLTGGTNELTPYDSPTGSDGGTTRVFHSAFKCPAVPAGFQQQV